LPIASGTALPDAEAELPMLLACTGGGADCCATCSLPTGIGGDFITTYITSAPIAAIASAAPMNRPARDLAAGVGAFEVAASSATGWPLFVLTVGALPRTDFGSSVAGGGTGCAAPL